MMMYYYKLSLLFIFLSLVVITIPHSSAAATAACSPPRVTGGSGERGKLVVVGGGGGGGGGGFCCDHNTTRQHDHHQHDRQHSSSSSMNPPLSGVLSSFRGGGRSPPPGGASTATTSTSSYYSTSRGPSISTRSTTTRTRPLSSSSSRPRRRSSTSSWQQQQEGPQQQQQQRQSAYYNDRRPAARELDPFYDKEPVPRQQQQQQQQDDSNSKTKEIIDAFLTRESRNTFIARVYAILSGQLLITACSVLFFGLNPNLSIWMKQRGTVGSYIPWISMMISSISWYMMCDSPTTRRHRRDSTNTNTNNTMQWRLLTTFTLGEAIIVGFISSFYKFVSVISAMIATAIATITVSLYTANQNNSKYDLSQWGAGLSTAGIIFLVYGMIQLFQVMGIIPIGFIIPKNDAIYGFLGATLFSFYLAYHTKLIVGGKHAKYQMNEQDYIFGAMALYNDIINIFIYLLRLVGEDKD